MVGFVVSSGWWVLVVASALFMSRAIAVVLVRSLLVSMIGWVDGVWSVVMVLIRCVMVLVMILLVSVLLVLVVVSVSGVRLVILVMVNGFVCSIRV